MEIALLIIVLGFAITSLNAKESVNSLISFALMMLFLGIYYLYLNEKLLGLFQIFVYTGGISVLMLFGITLIGTTLPKVSRNPFSALGSFLFFITLSYLFLINSSELREVTNIKVEQKELFSLYYSDMTIIFALIGTSLIYATVKVIKKLRRVKNI